MRFRLVALLSLLLVSSTLLAGDVRVFAAASLSDALREIASRYEQRSGDRIVFNFAGSSLLARQIEQGAPADLFLSADDAKMDQLAKRNRIDPATRIAPLSNELVVVVANDATRAIRSASQLAAVDSIAIGEPSSVPAGIYARQWLEREGIWAQLAPKVVPTANVRGALAAVESGNVDAAIVYRTDARAARRSQIAMRAAGERAPRIVYPFALVSGSGNRSAAIALLRFLNSKPALDIFRKHGFIVR